MFKKLHLVFLFFWFGQIFFAQNVELFTQWNGRYDFTFIGNTLNPNENSYMNSPSILDSSTATLNLTTDDTIIAAYLYWAGSGTGDFDIKLNGTDFNADIQYNINGTNSNLEYFSAFKDVTSFIIDNGNGVYTFSDLDLSPFITDYYNINKTNFGGWAILVIYENPNLTLNQINIYQGLESLSPISPFFPDPFINSKTIILNNLYLISNTGAKIGFVAWEGDAYLGYEESLKFTTNQVYTLSNTLNPPTNAFNNTDTESNSSALYNMDLDVYSIENYIQPGMTSAEVRLQSGWDYVMLNTIVTKLNSQLPDATIVLNDYSTSCNSGSIELDYTVFNVNSTEVLPVNTQIGFYIGTDLIGTGSTQNDIAIGDSENGTITLTLPTSTAETFILTANVDYNLAVIELNENNNLFEMEITQWLSPPFNLLPSLETCNLGLTKGIFDFSNYEELVTDNSDYSVSFHENYNDAVNDDFPILNTSSYEANTTPKEIFVRLENDLGCYSITSFQLLTKNCPPIVYNAVSANNDGMNDDFFIDGLRDIFVNFKLEIYNRWGRLLWTGDNSKPNWNGYVADGVGTTKAPEGTYYYILHLNDPDYTEPLTGYLYITY